MGWQWRQLDHMQIICTSLQTDNHASTSSLNFYRPDAFTDRMLLLTTNQSTEGKLKCCFAKTKTLQFDIIYIMTEYCIHATINLTKNTKILLYSVKGSSHHTLICTYPHAHMQDWLSRVYRPTKHIIGHIGDEFYGLNDPTVSKHWRK